MNNGIPTFVKWAGGKKQLLEQFKLFFPNEIERYHEPFIGGGAVAFYVIKHYKPKEIFLSDINEELINAYLMIRNNVEELIKLLKEHKKNHNEEYYYKIRALKPENLSKVERAGRLIYLNKTCFNGLYRVNSKGKFNVPIGSYENPLICPEKELREISVLLKDAKIECMSFEGVLKNAKMEDFIYFDPPYYPLKEGKSFTSYTKEAFLEKEQRRLAEVFDELNKRDCKVMLSNSDTPLIESLYKKYKPLVVKAKRMINCNAKGRGEINELIITNY